MGPKSEKLSRVAAASLSILSIAHLPACSPSAENDQAEVSGAEPQTNLRQDPVLRVDFPNRDEVLYLTRTGDSRSRDYRAYFGVPGEMREVDVLQERTARSGVVFLRTSVGKLANFIDDATFTFENGEESVAKVQRLYNQELTSPLIAELGVNHD